MFRRLQHDSSAMHTRDWAKLYIDRGWRVVKLEPRSKACLDRGWRDRVYTPEDFEPDSNIGLRALNGLVDVDCDTPESVQLADRFLPKTITYGRRSKPRSHWLYRCTDLSTPTVFKDRSIQDDKKATLGEVRIGHQSMAPPSIHPDGEMLTWDDYDDPTQLPEPLPIEGAALLHACRQLFTASLLARHYNPPGDRHEWCLAVAGALRYLKCSETECERIVLAAASLAGDGKTTDRKREIIDTYAKGDDEPVKSFKALEQLGNTGPAFVKSLKEIWGGVEVQQSVIDKLNEKHAVIFLQSGDMVVMTETVEGGRPHLRLSKPSLMPMLYPEVVQVGSTSRGTPIFKPKGAYWFNSPRRRFYHGLELAPNGNANPGYYNMWRGFSVEPKRGEWPLFREHIRTVAGHNPEVERYILAWMSQTVKHPDTPIGKVLAVKGKPGTGKSTFARWFGALFGDHFLHLDSEHSLLGRFNAHLHNAVVVLADEAVWAGSKAGIGALKRMITEPTLVIERKGIDTQTVKNMLHMLVASNEDWVVPVSFDDRRFAVFVASNDHREDTKFFDAVYTELFKRDGMAAMLHDLLEWKDDLNLNHIPETQERRHQKRQSLSPKMSWWLEVLEDGRLWNRKIIKGFIIDRDELYDSYVRTVTQANRHMVAGAKIILGKFLNEVLPDPYPDTYQDKATGKRYWVFPSLQVCREYFEKNVMSGDWGAEPREAGDSTEDIPF